MSFTITGKRFSLYICLSLLAAEVRAVEYFPEKKSAQDPGISEFEVKWFSKHLSRMNETSLFESAKAPGISVYRLTILPTWGNPIAIRFEKKNELYRLTAKRLSGEGGYDPGKLVETKEVTLRLPIRNLSRPCSQGSGSLR